jgi:allophanate hydrolase
LTDSTAATIAELHDAFRDGSARPSTVVERWLARPAQVREAPVWISTVDAATLRERARRLDVQLADDPVRALASPVFGALVAVKDNIDVAGLPTTAACPAFAYHPAASAPVVEALERAGALIVGKTNLDQFATGLVGTRSPYGPVPNAFDPTLVSGGSSSGSAVAVALGLVHASLGTDTAGSGRVPAALNNIVGWKPTRGLLSTRGVVPACRSFDCVSIFALTVDDAARVFAATAVHDRLDPAARATPLDAPFPHAFRFAIPRARDLEFFGDAAAAHAFDDATARLGRLGGAGQMIDFAPWRGVAAMLYEGAHVAERHAGIRAFFDKCASAVDPTVRTIIAGSARYTATDAYEAQAALASLRVDLARLWDEVDVLAVPSVPTTYAIADVLANPIELNRRLGTYTNFVNLLDLAAIAVPASIRVDGRPSGITLIGPAGSDLKLAALAQRFHVDTRLQLGALPHAMPAPQSLWLRADAIEIAVVGAHLSGLPLNGQLTERRARLLRSLRTRAAYRLYALPGTTPPKPGLVRTQAGGASIEVEVWSMPTAAFGSFVAGVPPPLAIGTVDLDDGSSVHGFLCESAATDGAEDITRHGGWRAYLASLTPSPAIPLSVP